MKIFRKQTLHTLMILFEICITFTEMNWAKWQIEIFASTILHLIQNLIFHIIFTDCRSPPWTPASYHCSRITFHRNSLCYEFDTARWNFRTDKHTITFVSPLWAAWPWALYEKPIGNRFAIKNDTSVERNREQAMPELWHWAEAFIPLWTFPSLRRDDRESFEQ